MFKITDATLKMDDLLQGSDEFQIPQLGSLVKGKVVGVKKNQIVVDLGGVAVGIISGKESRDSSGTHHTVVPGDDIEAVVVEAENEYGMIVLSLQKASQASTWEKFESAYRNGDILEVTVTEANKGGLLLDVDGIKGFIPVSQLAPVHYPRVDGADANEILTRLQRLVGQGLHVKVINLDRETGKMILSERAAAEKESSQALSQLTIGDVVTGKVSGVVKFGIFVTFNGLEGLVHISEIAWGHVSDPHQYAKVGQEVQVAIIGIENDKLSLSIKRLTPDPWEKIADNYPIGSVVKGTVTRFSQYGAFVQLEDDITGLIHLSEISDEKVDDPKNFLKVGEKIEAQVINIDSEERRIGLSIKALKSPKETMAKEAAASEEEKPKKKKKEE
jgi:small subunit ribosomal protein S1